MRIKIGLFNDSFPPTIDGVANTVLNYASILQKKFGDVVVVTPKYPKVTDQYPFEVFRYQSIPTPGKLPYRAGNPFSPVSIGKLKKKQFQLIHSHSPFASSLFASRVAGNRRRQCPIVFTYHTKFDFDIDKYVKCGPVNRLAKKFVLHNIENADEVWVVSTGAGEDLRRSGYNGPFRVMQNGCDFARGQASTQEIEALKQEYGLDAPDCIFLFVGRMMWYKNVKLILDALKIVQDAGVRYHAFFVGGGTDLPDMERYARQLAIDGRVRFTGPVYDRARVRAFFSLADLFVFPSTYDTSGLVVKEAAACACPSLLVRASCAAEDVEDGVSGFLCEENAQSCAKSILSALGQPGLLQTVGKTAQETIYLSWEDAVTQAYRRYEALVEAFERKNADA